MIADSHEHTNNSNIIASMLYYIILCHVLCVLWWHAQSCMVKDTCYSQFHHMQHSCIALIILYYCNIICILAETHSHFGNNNIMVN